MNSLKPQIKMCCLYFEEGSPYEELFTNGWFTDSHGILVLWFT